MFELEESQRETSTIDGDAFQSLRRGSRPSRIKSHSRVVANKSQLAEPRLDHALRDRAPIICFDLEDPATRFLKGWARSRAPDPGRFARPRQARSIASLETR